MELLTGISPEAMNVYIVLFEPIISSIGILPMKSEFFYMGVVIKLK